MPKLRGVTKKSVITKNQPQAGDACPPWEGSNSLVMFLECDPDILMSVFLSPEVWSICLIQLDLLRTISGNSFNNNAFYRIRRPLSSGCEPQ